MKLMAGLGNPGKKYANTRHNVGFLAVDCLAKLLGCQPGDWKESRKAQALYLKTTADDQPIELLKPQTFMNDSGISVAYAAKNHSLKPTDIIIVHDDKDIPLGEYRMQTNRGAAGHNGVKSIIEHLGTQNFTRVRIGIAPTEKNISDTADFVLDKFSGGEKKLVESVIQEVTKKIILVIKSQQSSKG